MHRSLDHLTRRSDYFSDPAAFAGLVDLLKDTFDIDIGLQSRFGGPDKASMPFGYFDAEGICVANFSAFPMPLVIEGRSVRAVGYQSGAVRPAYRGQGLYRDLMCRAFAWAEGEGFELGILLTDKPKLYQSYGFQSLPQHAFCGKAPAPVAARSKARLLTLDAPADIELIQRLLAVRQPVSNVFSVTEPAYFLLNACFDPEVRLSHLPDSDVVAAWKTDKDGALRLLDVVGEAIPSLAEIVAALDIGASRVIACFATDRLDWPDGRAEPYAGSCELMISNRGNIVLPRGGFMLSPMADF